MIQKKRKRTRKNNTTTKSAKKRRTHIIRKHGITRITNLRIKTKDLLVYFPSKEIQLENNLKGLYSDNYCFNIPTSSEIVQLNGYFMEKEADHEYIKKNYSVKKPLAIILWDDLDLQDDKDYL